MLYVDTSALVKLVVREDESAALSEALGQVTWLTSELGRAELHRAIARYSPTMVKAASALLANVPLIRLEGAVINVACSLPPPALRTLDAMHIAAAMQVGTLEAIVTYDQRMQDACDLVGVAWSTPV